MGSSMVKTIEDYKGFFVIEDFMVADLGLRCLELTIYAFLWTLSDKGKHPVKIKQLDIGNKVGCYKCTVSKVTCKLIDKGIIEIKGSKTYIIRKGNNDLR